MGITLIGTYDAGNNSSKTHNVTRPFGAIDGDYLLITIFYYQNAAGTLSPYVDNDRGDGKLVQIAAIDIATAANDTATRACIYFYSKRLDTTKDVSTTVYTFRYTGSGTMGGRAYASIWRGVHRIPIWLTDSSVNLFGWFIGPYTMPENNSVIVTGLADYGNFRLAEKVSPESVFLGGPTDSNAGTGIGLITIRHTYSIQNVAAGTLSIGSYRSPIDNLMAALAVVLRADSTGPYWESPYGLIYSSEVEFVNGGGFGIQIRNLRDDGWPGTAGNIHGIGSVMFYVWTTAGGQDDLVGHNGSRTSGIAANDTSDWSVYVPFSSHGNQGGEYNCHIYAADMQGYSSFIAGFAINVITNHAPTLLVRDAAGNPVANGQSILIGTDSDYTIKITGSDVDAGDTIWYRVRMRGATRTDWTVITKDEEFSCTIPFAELLIGGNIVQVDVQDAKSTVTSLSFALRNKITMSLSNSNLLTVIQALGYSNTSHASLNALKPAGYSRPTVSLAEIWSELL